MSLTLNMIGGNKEIIAFINIIYPEGSACSCTNGTKTLTPKDTSGTWTIELSDVGTWTVESSNNNGEEIQYTSKEITVEAYHSYDVELAYESIPKLQVQVNDLSIPVLVSTTIGDWTGIDYNNKNIRTSAEPILFVAVTTGNYAFTCGCISISNVCPTFQDSFYKIDTTPIEIVTNDGYKLYLYYITNAAPAHPVNMNNTIKTKDYTVGSYTSLRSCIYVTTGEVMPIVPQYGSTDADQQEADAQVITFNEVLDAYARIMGAAMAEGT